MRDWRKFNAWTTSTAGGSILWNVVGSLLVNVMWFTILSLTGHFIRTWFGGICPECNPGVKLVLPGPGPTPGSQVVNTKDGSCHNGPPNHYPNMLHRLNSGVQLQAIIQTVQGSVQSRVEHVLKKLQTVWISSGPLEKSTLARALFDCLSSNEQFEYTCFVADRKEMVKWYSGKQLTHRVLEGLKCKGRKLSREDVDWSILKGKKVLFVIEDLAHADLDPISHHLMLQTDVTVNAWWFGVGSRLIVTSSNESHCQQTCQDIFKVQVLPGDDSRELVIHHACASKIGSYWDMSLQKKGESLGGSIIPGALR